MNENVNFLKTMNYGLQMKRGVTLLEIIVVLTILTLLAVITFSALPKLTKRNDLSSSVQITASLLAEARSKTLSAENDTQYGVRFLADRAVFFSGAAFSSSTPGNIEKVFPPSVQISSTTLQGGGTDIIFSRLTGDTAQYGTIDIRSLVDASATSTISVGQRGNIKVQ